MVSMFFLFFFPSGQSPWCPVARDAGSPTLFGSFWIRFCRFCIAIGIRFVGDVGDAYRDCIVVSHRDNDSVAAAHRDNHIVSTSNRNADSVATCRNIASDHDPVPTADGNNDHISTARSNWDHVAVGVADVVIATVHGNIVAASLRNCVAIVARRKIGLKDTKQRSLQYFPRVAQTYPQILQNCKLYK